MKNYDLVIVSNLRENCREPLTKLSRKTRIPVTTLFEKLKSYDGNLIRKFTSIVDFAKLGYKTKAQVLIKPLPETKNSVEEFLQKNKKVNSLYKTGTNYEYLAEVICIDLQDFHDFLSQLESLKLQQKEVLFVVDDLKREEFLTNAAV